MAFQVAVHPLQHGGKCRGFARSGGARDDQDPRLAAGHLPEEGGGNPELVKVGRRCIDPAQDGGVETQGTVKVHAETHSLPGDITGIVVVGGVRDAAVGAEFPEVLTLQGWSIHRRDTPGNPHDGRLPRMEDQVGGIVFLGGPAVELDGFRRGGHRLGKPKPQAFLRPAAESCHGMVARTGFEPVRQP